MSNGGSNTYNNHSTQTTSSATRSQSRAGRFRSDVGRYLQQVKSRLGAFKHGTNQRNRRTHPTPEELDARSHRQFNQHSSEIPTDPGIATAMATEQVVVDCLVEEMHE